MDASNDGSESVDQFLARIASLNSKQGEEEAERAKRTEDQMLQARKERQARRAGMLTYHLLSLRWEMEAMIPRLTSRRACAIAFPFQDRSYTLLAARRRHQFQAQSRH